MNDHKSLLNTCFRTQKLSRSWQQALEAAFFPLPQQNHRQNTACGTRVPTNLWPVDSCSSYNHADNHAVLMTSTASTQNGWGVLVLRRFFNTPNVFALLLCYRFDGPSNAIKMLLIRNAFLLIQHFYRIHLDFILVMFY